MKNDFKRIGISSDDYQLGDTSIESFGGFIGSLFDLFQGGTLGDQVVERRGEFFGGEGSSSF